MSTIEILVNEAKTSARTYAQGGKKEGNRSCWTCSNSLNWYFLCPCFKPEAFLIRFDLFSVLQSPHSEPNLWRAKSKSLKGKFQH